MNLKLLSNEIKNNKNLEINLPQFMNEMSSVLTAYSGTNFVMHYYDLYEGLVDTPKIMEESMHQRLAEVNLIVRDALLQPFDGGVREVSIKKIHEIREEIMKSMKVLTAYTDVFTLYEYVLNRMELRFADRFDDIDNDVIAREILNYIFAEKDNVIVNDRIKQMLSQMPVRMTKEKFFDLLKNALNLYEDAEKVSLDNFLYMIRSASGLEKPEGMDTCFPIMKEYNDYLAKLEFEQMDEEGYNKKKEVLEKATDFLVKTTDLYYSLQQVVNQLYAFLLNEAYASVAVMNEFHQLKEIVSVVNERFLSGVKESIPTNIVALFEQTEGRVEETAMQVQVLQGILDLVTNNHVDKLKPLMLDSLYSCLIMSSKLISDSIFIELGDNTNASISQMEKNSEGKVCKEDINKAFNLLYEELSKRLETQGKMLNRAMIATVLKELPVFFSNYTEVMNYVKNSLAGCRDLSEKTVCIRLMKVFIEESK